PRHLHRSTHRRGLPRHRCHRGSARDLTAHAERTAILGPGIDRAVLVGVLASVLDCQWAFLIMTGLPLLASGTVFRPPGPRRHLTVQDRKSTRLNSSHVSIS